MEINSTS